MTVVSGHTKKSTSASPVTRYWLANCAGFSVAGGGRGTVERVITESDPYTPVELEIRHGHRRRRLPLASVLEIVPADHVLIVRGSGRGPARRAAVVRAAGVAGVTLLAVATWLVRAGKDVVRLVRSLPWQQYGRFVRSVMTRAWQEISTRSSRLRTTSSARRSESGSESRARTTSSI
jgi:hypothetical protein